MNSEAQLMRRKTSPPIKPMKVTTALADSISNALRSTRRLSTQSGIKSSQLAFFNDKHEVQTSLHLSEKQLPQQDATKSARSEPARLPNLGRYKLKLDFRSSPNKIELRNGRQKQEFGLQVKPTSLDPQEANSSRVEPKPNLLIYKYLQRDAASIPNELKLSKSILTTEYMMISFLAKRQDAKKIRLFISGLNKSVQFGPDKQTDQPNQLHLNSQAQMPENAVPSLPISRCVKSVLPTLSSLRKETLQLINVLYKQSQGYLIELQDNSRHFSKPVARLPTFNPSLGHSLTDAPQESVSCSDRLLRPEDCYSSSLQNSKVSTSPLSLLPLKYEESQSLLSSPVKLSDSTVQSDKTAAQNQPSTLSTELVSARKVINDRAAAANEAPSLKQIPIENQIDLTKIVICEQTERFKIRKQLIKDRLSQQSFLEASERHLGREESTDFAAKEPCSQFILVGLPQDASPALSDCFFSVAATTLSPESSAQDSHICSATPILPKETDLEKNRKKLEQIKRLLSRGSIKTEKNDSKAEKNDSKAGDQTTASSKILTFSSNAASPAIQVITPLKQLNEIKVASPRRHREMRVHEEQAARQHSKEDPKNNLQNKAYRSHSLGRDMNHKHMQMSLDSKSALNRFKKLKYLGKGCLSDVYSVIDTKTGLVAALKTIQKSIIVSKGLTCLINNEIKIQSVLQHPNILKIYGLFQDSRQIAMLLELSDCTLSQIMQQKPLSQEEIVLYAYQIISAVQYLHSMSIIHRDIKPENILVNQGMIKVADFGIACYGRKSNQFCGTLGYMAPEIEERREYDAKVDCYSIGVLIYQMCYQKIYSRQPIMGSTGLHRLMIGLLERSAEKRLTLEEALEMRVMKESSEKMRALNENIKTTIFDS